jgi:hypothetical protein
VFCYVGFQGVARFWCVTPIWNKLRGLRSCKCLIPQCEINQNIFLWRTTMSWEDNIKMNRGGSDSLRIVTSCRPWALLILQAKMSLICEMGFGEVWCDGECWMKLAQDRVEKQVLVLLAGPDSVSLSLSSCIPAAERNSPL